MLSQKVVTECLSMGKRAAQGQVPGVKVFATPCKEFLGEDRVSVLLVQRIGF
jgi:hypothetical protein